MKENLMTDKEFNEAVAALAETVKRKSLTLIVEQTKSYSGQLRAKLRANISVGRDDGVARSIGFKFLRYGAFVEYGAGRGYVVKDGVIMHGHRIKEGTAAYSLLAKRGYTKKELSKAKFFASPIDIKRRAKPWLDPVLTEKISSLADIAGEYYGDETLRHVLDQLNRITIKKNYGKE